MIEWNISKIKQDLKLQAHFVPGENGHGIFNTESDLDIVVGL